LKIKEIDFVLLLNDIDGNQSQTDSGKIYLNFEKLKSKDNIKDNNYYFISKNDYINNFEVSKHGHYKLVCHSTQMSDILIEKFGDDKMKNILQINPDSRKLYVEAIINDNEYFLIIRE